VYIYNKKQDDYNLFFFIIDKIIINLNIYVIINNIYIYKGI